MTSWNCKRVHELLVDYADGQLQSDATDDVDAHLRGCAECRRDLVRLNRSLQLTQHIWKHADLGVCRSTIPFRPALQITFVRATAACACGLLLVAALSLSGGKRDVAQHVNPSPAIANNPEPLVLSQPNQQSIEQMIARAEVAARLEASSMLLTPDPTLRSYREQTDRLLVKHFADLDAGQQAQRRLAQNN